MTRTKIIILNLAPKWQLSNFSFFVHELSVGAYFKVCKVLSSFTLHYYFDNQLYPSPQYPRIVLVYTWESSLVTNSILFCWLFTISDQCVFTQSRFASVVFDGILAPSSLLRLSRYTWWCPCIAVVAESMFKTILRAFEGHYVCSKRPQRARDQGKGWLGQMKVKNILADEVSLICPLSKSAISYPIENR